MEIKITKLQKDIIIGSLLGDGCLEFNGFKGTRLQIKQSAEHKEYVSWLYSCLGNLCNSGPRRRKDNNQWYFSTKHIDALSRLQRIFYPKGRKAIPNNILRLLTSSLSLAVWYMDDGTLDFRPKSHFGIFLTTYSFSKSENQRLVSVLKNNFKIEANVHSNSCRNKKYWRIYIGKNGRDRFVRLVQPYILTCFRYKLPPEG